MSDSDYRFEVAISFAGDDKRDLVRRIAELLAAELGEGRVFFDEWYEAELAGPDAHVVLQNFYETMTRLVVTCICQRYNEKPWTQDEWRAIQVFERGLRDAKEANIKRMRFLPLRFGDGEIDGLFSNAIVPDVRGRSAEQIADLILKRLDLSKRSNDEAISRNSDSGSAPASTGEHKAENNRVVRPNKVMLNGSGSPPAKPSLFVGRERDISAIKSRLGIRTEHTTEEDQEPLSCVRGWPGVGKTSTVIMLARDVETQAAFPDGVLWTSLGQEPRLQKSFSDWGGALGSDAVLRAGTLEEAAARLHQVLRERHMLLIVDDVWEVEHALRFRDATPKTCTLLFTTRLGTIADQLDPSGSSVYKLPVLDEEFALQLLGKLAPMAVAQHQEECSELVRDLECLPLSLHVAGNMLAAEAKHGWGVKDLLKELRDGLKLLHQKAPTDRFDKQQNTLPTVGVLMDQSTSRLDERMRECFSELGVFAPKPATFDLTAMQAVWTTEVDDTKSIVRELVSRGLLEPVGGGRFQMHALLVAHAQTLLD